MRNELNRLKKELRKAKLKHNFLGLKKVSFFTAGPIILNGLIFGVMLANNGKDVTTHGHMINEYNSREFDSLEKPVISTNYLDENDALEFASKVVTYSNWEYDEVNKVFQREVNIVNIKGYDIPILEEALLNNDISLLIKYMSENIITNYEYVNNLTDEVTNDSNYFEVYTYNYDESKIIQDKIYFSLKDFGLMFGLSSAGSLILAGMTYLVFKEDLKKINNSKNAGFARVKNLQKQIDDYNNIK